MTSATAVAWRVYSGVSAICSAAAAAAAAVRDGLSPSFLVWRRLRTRKNSVNEKNAANESTTYRITEEHLPFSVACVLVSSCALADAMYTYPYRLAVNSIAIYCRIIV